jgi:hypothetical protein
MRSRDEVERRADPWHVRAIGYGAAWCGRRLLVALVAAFVLVGCNQDDDPDMGTRGATVPPVSSNWLDTLLNAASEGTVTTQPTAVLSQGEIDQMHRSFVVPSSAAASIATQLRSIDASWSVGEADIVQFADEICTGRPSVAAANLFAKIPTADMGVLPQLNEAIAFVQQRCAVTNPVVLDEAANGVLRVLTANQQSRPPEPVQPAESMDRGMSDLYAATCAGANGAVTAWAKERLNAGEGGGILLSTVIAAGMTNCPETLATIFGTDPTPEAATTEGAAEHADDTGRLSESEFAWFTVFLGWLDEEVDQLETALPHCAVLFRASRLAAASECVDAAHHGFGRRVGFVNVTVDHLRDDEDVAKRCLAAMDAYQKRLIMFDAYVESLQQAGTNRQAEKFMRMRSQATRQARAYRTARDAALLACEPQ